MPKLPKTVRARARKVSAKLKKLKKTQYRRWTKYCADVAKAPLESGGPSWKSPQQVAREFQEKQAAAKSASIEDMIYRTINPPVTTGAGLEHLTRRGWESLPPRKDGLYMTRNPIRIVPVLVPIT
jgi:hypothetical protein